MRTMRTALAQIGEFAKGDGAQPDALDAAAKVVTLAKSIPSIFPPGSELTELPTKTGAPPTTWSDVERLLDAEAIGRQLAKSASSWPRSRTATSVLGLPRPVSRRGTVPRPVSDEVRMSWLILPMMIGFGLLWSAAFAAVPLPTMQETPALLEQVRAGALPPVGQRIPEHPRILERFAGGDGPGQPGGQLNMLVAGSRDTLLMTVYGYTRLIVYDDRFELQPDILESYDVKDGREFTLKLRAGHKWSDGQPFTTEDFRFFWEDVANNKELSPSGPPVELLVDGLPPRVDIVDERTIKYSWDKPNPYFIDSQARAAPLFLFRPAHYLKRFHVSYTPEKKILKSARGGEQAGRWIHIYRHRDAMYANGNIDLPTLNPWVNTTPSPAGRYVFVRNQYFHRIDANGRQLPYIDRVTLTVAAAGLIPARAALGEADLQVRYLNMRDYTFLQKSSKAAGVAVRLWQAGVGAPLAFYPNLNANDAVWRTLMRDVRFRRALSLAIDRDELNQVVFLGLARPSNNTVMERSELFKPRYAAKWTNHDRGLADKLLDEIGLTVRDPRGIRRLPDGRPATIVVEYSSEQTEDSDILELVADHWRDVGIEMLIKPQTRDNLRRRAFIGEAIMTAFEGVVTTAPTIDSSPREFAPTTRGALQWSRWGMFVESNGKQGERCDLEAACKLLDYVRAWERTTDPAARRKAWRAILQANADEVFSIGTVNGIRQPIVVGLKLRNVPKAGYYAWDPGGYIGLYQPDTFWIAQ
jgi:peptide/nickel transport system substrate-binding protein